MAGIVVIMILVFILPFTIKEAEEELEIFLFIMGLAAVTIAGAWSPGLLKEALTDPVKITIVVFLAGLVFNMLQKTIARNVNRILKKTGIKVFVFSVVVVLGLLSSVITAIIAAIVLAEIIGHLKLDRKDGIIIVIMSCFSIGLGAALTPVGEPLSAIVTAKLAGEPYRAGFWFLAEHLGIYIIPGIICAGILAVILTGKASHKGRGLKVMSKEDLKDIILRAGKVYLFIAGLVLLGAGFRIIADAYVSKMPFYLLYWVNMVSAVVDNATLAAAEVGPSMGIKQIISAMLGLVLAGGMLIPGNIPNIIAAGKLKIKSKEWAKTGVLTGLVFMVLYFIIILAGGVK
jgi:predicted cation transporter